jgi:hypothetical protein
LIVIVTAAGNDAEATHRAATGIAETILEQAGRFTVADR